MSRSPLRRLWHPVWKRLASRRTAVRLLLFLALVLLVAQLVPQAREMTPEELDGLVAESQLLQVADALHLTRIKGSTFFYTLLLLVIVNLSANLVQRLGTLRKELQVRCPRQRPDKLAGQDPYRRVAAAPGADPLAAAEGALRQRGYVVDRRGDGLVGVKGRWAVLGSLAFHISMIVMGAGGIASSATKVRGLFWVGETETFDGRPDSYAALAPSGLAAEDAPKISFRVDTVEVTVDDQDRVLDVAVAITAADGETDVIRVNYPWFGPDGVVRLVEYGFAPVISLRDPVHRTEVTTALKLMVTPAGKEDAFTLAGVPGEFVLSLYPDFIVEGGTPASRGRNLSNPVAAVAWIAPGGARSLARLPRDATYRPLGPWLAAMPEVLHWARFEVHRDDGKWIVFAGLILALLGLAWRFALPVGRVDAAVEATEAGPVLHLAGRAGYTREPFASRFERLADAIVAALAPVSPEPPESTESP